MTEIYGIYNGQGITETTFNHLSSEEKNKVLTGEVLQTALQGKKEAKIIINAKEYDLTTEQGKLALGDYLISCGFSYTEVTNLIDNPMGLTQEKLNDIQTRLNTNEAEAAQKKGRANNVLIMDADRYAKLEPFKEQEHLENPFEKNVKTNYPQADYPDLYKKDGSINEKKVWKQVQNDLFFEVYTGKTEKQRIAELTAQGKSEEEAKKSIDAQNKAFLKQLETAERYQNEGKPIDEATQKFLDCKDGAKDFTSQMKKFKENIDKCYERINNAIDKMNSWDWNKDLNEEQREKIRKAVADYNFAQESNGGTSIDMFDENGNLKDKNLLYQFVMDHITGTDAQVNKSAKKGNFFQKIFKKENKEFTEKRAARELGLEKKDIEKMGFDWENQINWGTVVIDGLKGGAVATLLALPTRTSKTSTDSDTATAHAEATAIADAQATASATAVADTGEIVIDADVPYEGAVDYQVNGETVMEIPYGGVTDFFMKLPGKIVENTVTNTVSNTVVATATDTATATADAQATATTSAVLPAAIIGTITASINSMINQGVNGQEKDIFNNNLYYTLSKKGSSRQLQSGDDVATYCGLNPGSSEFKMARDIANYYFDDKGTFHSQEFLTDWHYNGGYDSKYLNSQEAAVWLQKLKERGPIKTFKPDNQVSGVFNETPGQSYSISGVTAKDLGGLARQGATGTHSADTIYDFAEGLTGEVIVEMKDDQTPINFNSPDIIRGFDHSNEYNQMHEYKYEKLTSDEIAQAKRDGKLPANLAENAVIYRLASVTDHSNNEKSIISRHEELFQLDKVETNATNNQISSYGYRLVQTNGFAGYNRSAINSLGTINKKITRLNSGQ